MVGVEICFHDGSPAMVASLRVIKEMLQRGFIVLPPGRRSDGNVISFTPPLTITRAELTQLVKALAKVPP